MKLSYVASATDLYSVRTVMNNGKVAEIFNFRIVLADVGITTDK